MIDHHKHQECDFVKSWWLSLSEGMEEEEECPIMFAFLSQAAKMATSICQWVPSNPTHCILSTLPSFTHVYAMLSHTCMYYCAFAYSYFQPLENKQHKHCMK